MNCETSNANTYGINYSTIMSVKVASLVGYKQVHAAARGDRADEGNRQDCVYIYVCGIINCETSNANIYGINCRTIMSVKVASVVGQ